MGQPGYIFGQFQETMRCRDAQHGDGVCCAFTPQVGLLLLLLLLQTSTKTAISQRHYTPPFSSR